MMKKRRTRVRNIQIHTDSREPPPPQLPSSHWEAKGEWNALSVQHRRSGRPAVVAKDGCIYRRGEVERERELEDKA